MTTAIVRVILHGGLGNQLFQYFIGLLEKRQRGAILLRLDTHALAHYSTARDFELVPLVPLPSDAPKVVVDSNRQLARLRLPKILQNVFKREFIVTLPFCETLVDGYFQHMLDFERYPKQLLDDQLSEWRNVLSTKNLLQAAEHDRVTHIRLGDFFSSGQSARRFARDHLSRLQGVSDLLTDQEDLVQSIIEELGVATRLRLVRSGEMNAWALFRHFSRYRHVETNGSSLAFWAATLAGADFTSSNPEHEAIHRLLCPKAVAD